ncbi:hypothetical protein K458DRAFT_176384 [Lentithecium fluviatile CBS 122367]|uniref:Uncharacterized protein n=1 Tax=Lentithecium fluviatile CBS 122367 TaxID=1168545 RepID=A0A6G1JCA0_9PLEO|nr:hypothetical protein K458DRAFT_176384 [Lentithecium fluviatile CBS 122367]
MSWSGPVAGAPYQPPSFPQGQPAFGQPQTYQYGQQPGNGQYQPAPTYPQPGVPPQNRPPKKKGNPIITKYPPPPGYRGPAQPQGPYGATQYQGQYPQYPPAQQPQQSYPQAPSTPSAYPTQGYQAPPAPAPQSYPPQTYGQPPTPSYQQAPNYQWPQATPQGYAQQPGFSQPPSYPNGQAYTPHQGAYPGWPAPPTPVEQNQQNWSQPQGWQQLSPSGPYLATGHFNSFAAPPVNSQPVPDPNALPTPVSAHPANSQSTPLSAQPPSATGENALGEKGPLNLALYDWDFDFDGAIWPKANEPVDPNFSLGQIVWHPAQQVTRALPSTFAEAEEQAADPPAARLENGESVSIYFTAENSYEAFLHVKQTDEWDKIKDDPIFVEFTDEKMAPLMHIERCIALRDRPDEPFQEIKQEEDVEMVDSTYDVMGDLEQALSAKVESQKPSTFRQEASFLSDPRQEEALAKLGVVDGPPKPPSKEAVYFQSSSLNAKPPASLPPKPPAPPSTNIPPRPELPPHRAHSYGGPHNSTYGTPIQRSYGSLSSSRSTPPGPKRYEPQGSSISRDRPSGHTFDGARDSPAGSEGSGRMMAGSDFESEKTTNGAGKTAGGATQLRRSDSSFTRKRSYEDTDTDDQKMRQHDDHAKRKRRSQVAPAYSRR